MTFTGDISIGQLIPLVLFFVGSLGGYFTLRAQCKQTEDATKKASEKIAFLEREVSEYKLFAAQNYVSAHALREVKDDLAREIRDIEHVVRNALMSTLGNLGHVRRRPEE